MQRTIGTSSTPTLIGATGEEDKMVRSRSSREDDDLPRRLRPGLVGSVSRTLLDVLRGSLNAFRGRVSEPTEDPPDDAALAEADEGSLIRPIAIDDSIDFIDVEGPEQADLAQQIFAIQWDFVHGYVGRDALDQLPATFAGRPVVRDPRTLIALARRGDFDIDELYRELFE